MTGLRCSVKAMRCVAYGAPRGAHLAGIGSSGKGAPGQSTTRPLRGRRVAPTSLRCSAGWPAAELASLTAFAALEQWRRVRSRSALARAATHPALLGAAQAHRGLSGHAFAGAWVVRPAREEPSRQAVAGGGDSRSGEDRRPGVGARSALAFPTRRSCSSAAHAVSEASSAPRPLAENRDTVGTHFRMPTRGAAQRVLRRKAEAFRSA